MPTTSYADLTGSIGPTTPYYVPYTGTGAPTSIPGVNPGDPTQTPSATYPTGNFDWIALAFGILIVGMVGEAIGTVSQKGAYLFALLVIMGYAATGGRLDNAVRSLRNAGIL